jgi:uncharacterized SAM-binding protein YcdF (DUF218 family)
MSMRVIQAIGVAVVAVFCVILFTPISNEASRHFMVGSSVRPSGAIVVLAAGIWRGGMLNDESLRRAVHGIELYKSQLAPVIVFSGTESYEEPTVTEAELRTKLALTMGVPHEAIIKEETSNTTRDESIRISALLTSRGVHDVLLVTESSHMRRAKYLFERAGMEVRPAPSDNLTVAAVSPGERVRLALRLTQESLALVYYRIAGYI